MAQIEADRKNKAFDESIRYKEELRKTLVKQTVLNNQDLTRDKNWEKDHQTKQVEHELTKANSRMNDFEQDKNLEMMDDKYKKRKQMQELSEMMNLQNNDHLMKTNNEIKLEKQLLKDATKFDVYVEDIMEERRKVLDKLRQDRPGSRR